MLDILSDLGLDPLQSRAYLACLQAGTNSIGAIAKNMAESRQNCLYALKKLIASGYASSFVRDGVSYYSAVPPQALAGAARRRLEAAESRLPELLALSKSLAAKPKIRFYQAEAMDVILAELEDVDARAFTDLDTAIAEREKDLIAFRDRRRDSSAKTRIVTRATARVRDFLDRYGMPRGDEYRFVEDTDFVIGNDIVLANSSVYVLSLSRAEPSAFVVESPAFFLSQSAVFEYFWKA